MKIFYLLSGVFFGGVYFYESPEEINIDHISVALPFFKIMDLIMEMNFFK